MRGMAAIATSCASDTTTCAGPVKARSRAHLKTHTRSELSRLTVGVLQYRLTGTQSDMQAEMKVDGGCMHKCVEALFKHRRSVHNKQVPTNVPSHTSDVC